MGTGTGARPDATAEPSLTRRLVRAFLAATLATGLVGVVGYLRRR